jgi:hypothetical protein
MGEAPATRRLLQIASSAICVAICLLLLVLWVASYRRCDAVRVWPDGVMIVTLKGELYVFGPYQTYSLKQGRFMSFPVGTVDTIRGLNTREGSFWADRRSFHFKASYWLLISLIAPLGIAPWVPWSWRFSLRAFAIAATYIAVVLGALMLCITQRT